MFELVFGTQFCTILDVRKMHKKCHRILNLIDTLTWEKA